MSDERRVVGPSARIYAWLEQHPVAEQWDAMLTWVRAVALAPELVTSESFHKPGTNRFVHLSHIPGANTTAVFVVVESPVRAVNIIRFDDSLFRPR